MRVIGYGSRSLSPAERNYNLHSGKLEFLALKWAVCEHFRDYLFYAPGFTVYTDNNPLTYVLTTAKLNATGHRWVAELADFRFTIKYRPGRANGDADALSRMPLDFGSYMKECTEDISPNHIKAAVEGVEALHSGNTTWISALTCDDHLLNMDKEFLDNRQPINNQTILQAQRQDQSISRVLTFQLEGKRPSIRASKRELPDTRALLRQWNKLKVGQDGLLRRESGPYQQLVLPRRFHPTVFHELHKEMGHLGAARVLQLARERFYWPSMERDINHFVTNVCGCLKQRRPTLPTRAPLCNVTTSSPFELVSIDFVHLERSSGGYEYILVIIDHFTRFAQAYPTKNKSSTTAATKLYNDFVLRFGFPEKILHDQGREFENKLFHQLEELSGVKRLRTTPYHPQGNGKTERFNRTLLSMLRTLPEDKKSRWVDSVNKVVHAYNCTRSDATGFSPFFLLFGRSPRLPIDLMFGTSSDATQGTHTEYAERWKSAMRDAYSTAIKNSAKSGAAGKRNYDQKVRFTQLKPGDRVLVRNLSERGGPGKLRSYWEDKIHLVVEQKSEMPVYEVKPEGHNGRSRVLHRNLLHPCEFLRPDNAEVLRPAVQRQNRVRPRVNQNEAQPANSDDSDSDGCVDEQVHYGFSPTEIDRMNSMTWDELCSQEQRTELNHQTPEHQSTPIEDESDPYTEAREKEIEEHQSEDSEEQEILPEVNADPLGDFNQRDDEARDDNTLTEAPVLQPGRPVRNRHPPILLNYGSLGNPSYYQPYASSVQSPNGNMFTQPMMYWPPPSNGRCPRTSTTQEP